MSFPSLERHFRESRLFRRVVQEWDFCTYREVRELDLDRVPETRALPPGLRQSARFGGSRPVAHVAEVGDLGLFR